MTTGISRLDRAMARACELCPVCRHARAQQAGVAYAIVRNVEGAICPFCRAYERVNGRKAHEAAAGPARVPGREGETMTEMIELLRKRRSIRKFTAEPVAPEIVELLVEALLRAPSSRGINPWEFILVDDRDLLAKLSRSKQHGSEFLKKAPLAVVVCADSTRSDVWIEDCAIASIIVQMTALSLGLGSCWAQIRNRAHDGARSAEDYIRDLLGLPEHVKVESIIGIGHPAESPKPVPAKDLHYGKVRRNGWQVDEG